MPYSLVIKDDVSGIQYGELVQLVAVVFLTPYSVKWALIPHNGHA